MGHHHHQGTGNVLKWSFWATAIFVVIELIAGVRSGSLALISDAGHNFTDALALLLAYLGVYLQSKPANDVKTYGYQRAGVLAAFLNALTLILIAVVIFYEGYRRIFNPQPVHEGTMMIVSAAGLLLNGGIMWSLRSEQAHDLNIRAAFIHMMGDALSSVAIFAGAVLIHYTGWDSVDPALSVLIGVLIIWSAWGIVKESLNILLEGLPSGLELKSVVGAMQTVDGVIDVHDLHIWSLGSNTHALSCHVLIEDMPPSASENILREVNRVLRGHFDIHHTTVQFEHTRCAVPDSGCSMSVETHRH